jgi:hypothetical protein
MSTLYEAILYTLLLLGIGFSGGWVLIELLFPKP